MRTKSFTGARSTIATQKLQPPSTQVTWLGIEINTQSMELRLPADQLEDILTLVRTWRGKTSSPLGDLQKLLGKLHYVSRCCKPARLFLNRMMDTLRGAHQRPQDAIDLDIDLKKDICWFADFLSEFNGRTMIRYPSIDYTI